MSGTLFMFSKTCCSDFDVTEWSYSKWVSR